MVAQRDGDAGLVLLLTEVLRVEQNLGAAVCRLVDEERLHLRLRDVADGAGAGEIVFGLPFRMIVPGEQAS